MGQTRKVALAAVCEGKVPRLRFDHGRLTLALTHLITNGIRFTPDGGHVDVRARWDGTVLEIAVHDNGIGIPPERHAALFERGAVGHDVRHHHSSTTLEFKSAGLGFGLSIARGIVQAHGGTLTLMSEPDNGSTFVMRLPLEQANARQEKAA
jgi:signal transduction histidine kinase